MTVGGALSELNNLLKADDIPFYYKPSIKAVMDTIALSNLEKPNKWIPVSERLPEADGRYLCTYEDDIEENCVDFGNYENGEWYVDKVIAWMPLPEPYKAERSEE